MESNTQTPDDINNTTSSCFFSQYISSSPLILRVGGMHEYFACTWKTQFNKFFFIIILSLVGIWHTQLYFIFFFQHNFFLFFLQIFYSISLNQQINFFFSPNLSWASCCCLFSWAGVCFICFVGVNTRTKYTHTL